MGEAIPERIQYLVGSAERVELLEALVDGPARQRALRDRCSMARSTVHRNLDGCKEWGWVVETDDGYALTAAGKRILDAYQWFAETVETLADHEPVLRAIHDFDPIPTAALEACETTPAAEADPHAPVISAANVIRRHAGERIRMLVSTVSPITNQAGWEALQGGSELALVVDRTVLETLRTSYEPALETVHDHDQCDLFVSPSAIDTGLVIAGDEVCVVVHDEGGRTQASLTGTNAQLRSWAGEMYRRNREGATRFEAERVAVSSER